MDSEKVNPQPDESGLKPHASLESLAEAFPTGTRIRYRLDVGSGPKGAPHLATVHGVGWSLPRLPGAPREPWLVIATDRSIIGNVYPDEVIAR